MDDTTQQSAEQQAILGMLVEVDGEAYEILSSLEEALETWVSGSDLCTLTGLSDTKLHNLVNALNVMTCSVYIEWENRLDDVYYRGEFRKLDGARIPLGGGTTFSEREEVEKIVEREVIKEVEVITERVIEKPFPVNVGGALLKQKIPATKTKKTAPKKTSENNQLYVWADTPSITSSMKDFSEPPFFESMKNMVEYGKHIALGGPPGIGKSTAVEQLAALHKVNLVSYSASGGLHKRDLEGTPEIRKDQSWLFVGEYATAVVEGWWVLIDEINTAHPDVPPYIMNQLAPPYKVTIKGKGYPVHKNFRLFVTYNIGFAGTKIMNQAFLDRFFAINVSYPDKDFLTRMLILNGCDNEEVMRKLYAFAFAVWSKSEDMRYQLSPRRLFDAALLQREGTPLYQAVTESVLPHVMDVYDKEEITKILPAIFGGTEVTEILEEGPPKKQKFIRRS